MNTLYLYATLAIAFLIVVVGLLRKPRPQGSDDAIEKKGYAPKVASGRWLNLSERIFDPSDARWLQEELAFPKWPMPLRWTVRNWPSAGFKLCNRHLTSSCELPKLRQVAIQAPSTDGVCSG